MQSEKTKLLLDGRWKLEELSLATKEYTQLYGFAYSLLPELPVARREEMEYIYGKFPWRGGFSTVNFFQQLFHKIPPKLRPEVQRIQYASPGFIELSELLLVAGSVAAIVAAVCTTINNAHDTYRKIQKGSVENELTQINLKKEQLDLTQKQINFCETSSASLVKVLGLTEAQDKLLDERVQNNKLMKVKILLSVFRRAEPLAEQQANGKLKITGEPSDGV
jgi:hypothetical protein